MTKLEELIYSLATVIVRYNSSQGNNINKLVSELESPQHKKQSREFAIEIMKNKEIKFEQQLKSLITMGTKGYAQRQHFLFHILNELTFLKMQLDRKVVFSPEELHKYQQQITQLFINFRQLLKTPKNALCTVKRNSLLPEGAASSIDLSGLINNGYVGNHFCNSGIILIEEVLQRFHMDIEPSDAEIEEIAISLCMEHQNALLVSELGRQKIGLETENALLAMEKIELEKEKAELEDKNQAQQTTIDNLREDLAKTQLELQKLREEPKPGEALALVQHKPQEKQSDNPKAETRFDINNPLLQLIALNALNQQKVHPGPLGQRFFSSTRPHQGIAPKENSGYRPNM